jgi:peptide/nickel transport system permease protein
MGLDPYTQFPDGLSALGTPLPPSLNYWLGTDDLGRDIFARFIVGGGYSLLLSSIITALVVLIAVGLGITAAYSKRPWVSGFVLRLSEIVQAFPGLLLAIAVASVLPSGPLSLIVTLSAVAWPQMMRTIYEECLLFLDKPFMEAARAQGADDRRMILNHLLPNILPFVWLLVPYKLAEVLLIEASLSFLGLGIPAPTPTWGRMIAEAKVYWLQAPWLMIPPALGLVVTVFLIQNIKLAKRK